MFSRQSIKIHKKLKGKIEIKSKAPLKTKKDLSVFYTPGVGAVSSYLAKNKKKAREMTIKNNSVAIVSDGSAVLGLGNIGPEGAIPVMEGKAMIFKEFGGVDAFPIVLNTQDTEEIIKAVQNIEPVFGGINLEDISAPRCFEIENRLKNLLDIPVFHDDQHGTAIVVLAGLINSFKIVKKDFSRAKIVIIGAGAAGIAIANLLLQYGAGDIILLDSQGIISKSRTNLNPFKKEMAEKTNKKNINGGIGEALLGADAVVGVSAPDIIKLSHVQSMAKKAVVFALSNPVPEIMPAIAKKAGAFIIATGRSDFPNQINNALVFPGIFRGALDKKVSQITDLMKINAAKKLAALLSQAFLIEKSLKQFLRQLPDRFNQGLK
ncbi:MAG: Malic enzyme, NAD binding domain protein [Parcubacteria group bacterium GW2011_GWF2_39_13b]|nr:MAG: Malic enzyme, NAD binding domain protein [Parcubacteria group bacterium GW2011_GWF2_39_13b]